MLQGAWRWGMSGSDRQYVERNVWAEAEAPRAGKALRPAPEETRWQPEHYQRFFAWAQEQDLRYWPAFMFTAETGERRSGNLGVHWDAVDLESRLCHLVFFVEQIDHRIVVKDYGKTNGGQRNVPFSHHVADALRHQKARQAAERLKASSIHVCASSEPNCPERGYHDRGLVFCQRNGDYVNPERFTREFRRAIDRYNTTHNDKLPVINVHALRHGWSSAADAVGAPEAMRMKHLGQTSAAVKPQVHRRDHGEVQDDIGALLFG